MVEQIIRNDQVAGSIPVGGSFEFGMRNLDFGMKAEEAATTTSPPRGDGLLFGKGTSPSPPVGDGFFLAFAGRKLYIEPTNYSSLPKKETSEALRCDLTWLLTGREPSAVHYNEHSED